MCTLSFLLLSSEDEFLLGWYSDSDVDYLKVLTGQRENRYSYIDPYCRYYNLFLNYSVYNRFILPDSINFKQAVPFLEIYDKVGFDKHFIVDLPRYSSLFRLFFAFPDGKANTDTTTFSVKIFDESHNEVNRQYIPEGSIFMGRNVKYPVYSFLTFRDNSLKGWYATFDFNSEKLMLSSNSPYVYRHGSIFGFSFRKHSGAAWFCVRIKAVLSGRTDYLNIFSSVSTDKHIPFDREGENSFFLDGFIQLRNDSFRQADLRHLFEEDLIISNPAYLSLGDTIFRPFEIDIKKLASLSGDSLDSIVDFSIYVKDADIADISISFPNDFSMNVLKIAIDKVLEESRNSQKLLGFYTADEIERSEVFLHDRWMRRYAAESYPSGRLTKKRKNTYLFLQNKIRAYIKSTGKIPFTLSTVHFYNENGGKFSDYNNRFTIFTDSFLFYDDYTNNRSFVDNFLKVSHLSDSLECRILFVNDAYSAKGHPARDFIRMRWKFFAPIIMGADGMLFYSYFSPKSKSFSQFISDTNKMTVGYLSKYITETGIRNSLLHLDEFKININDKESRISSVSSDSSGNIFFMYFIIDKSSLMQKNGNSRKLFFKAEDDDIRKIKMLMKENDCFVADITPNIDESNQNINDKTVANFYKTHISDSSNISQILNSGQYNILLSDYDIKIIKLYKNNM